MATKKTTPKKFLGLNTAYWLLIASLIAIVIVADVWYTQHRARSAMAEALIAQHPSQASHHASPTDAPAPGTAQTPAVQPGPPAYTADTDAYVSGLQPTPTPSTADQAPSAPVPSTHAMAADGLAQPLNDGVTASPASQAQSDAVLIATQQQQIQTLTAQDLSLGAQITSLQQSLATAEQANQLHADKIKQQQHEIVSLEGRLAHANRDKGALASTLQSRPVLPGWSVTAVNGSAAVLSGPGQAIRVVHVGDTLFGVRILSIDGENGSIKTSAGILRSTADE